jgi:aspartate aminotransferase
MVDRTIVLDGFSKTYAMTGWRLGYAIVPEKLVTPFSRLIVNSVSCTSAATQWAGVEALTGPQDSVAGDGRGVPGRRDLIVDGFNSIPGVSCLRPAGRLLRLPRHLRHRPERSRAGGPAAPRGRRLGSGRNGLRARGHATILRFSYANSRENIVEA